MKIYLGLGLVSLGCFSAFVAASCTSTTPGTTPSLDGAVPAYDAGALAACVASVVGDPADAGACGALETCVSSSCEAATVTVGQACTSFAACATEADCTVSGGLACYGSSSCTCQGALLALKSCALTSCATSLAACAGSLLGGLPTLAPACADGGKPDAASPTPEAGSDSSVADTGAGEDAAADTGTDSGGGGCNLADCPTNEGYGFACCTEDDGGLACTAVVNGGQSPCANHCGQNGNACCAGNTCVEGGGTCTGGTCQ